MGWRLIGCALALMIAASVGPAVGKPAVKEGPGVTTLEPPAGDGWHLSEDPNEPFTPVGVIGGHGQNADSDLDNPVAIAGPPTETPPATDPPRTTAPAKSAMGWLPEPATWVLLLIGLAMIGFALRGLVAARRRLTKLENLDS